MGPPAVDLADRHQRFDVLDRSRDSWCIARDPAPERAAGRHGDDAPRPASGRPGRRGRTVVTAPRGRDMNGGPDARFYPRVFALVAAALLTLAVVRMLQPFIGAILWSVLLAFLLYPVNRDLRRLVRDRRAVAAALLTIAVIVLVVVPAFLLGVAFTRQAAELFRHLQAAAGRYEITRPSDLLRIPVVHQLLQWAETVAPVSIEQVQGWLVNAATTLLALVAATSGAFVVEALGTLVSLIITLFLLFFFLRDGEAIVQRALLLVPLGAERQAHLVEHLSAVTRAVVFGSMITAIVQGTLVGIGFALTGLPSPVVFGVLAMVAALVPLVGTALVWVPAAAVLALQGRWGAAVFMVAWGIAVVAGADNVVRPLFISGRAQISTLPVFLGLAGGVAAFGPIGIVLGPVIVALVLALLRFAEESRASSIE
jgi:predicted PurR-regulated permease PerM